MIRKPWTSADLAPLFQRWAAENPLHCDVTLFTEGFDKYGPVGVLSPSVQAQATQGEWTSFGGGNVNFSVVAGLSSTGTAIRFGGGASNSNWLSKTLAANYGRIIGGFRFSTDLTTGSASSGIVFRDGASAQFAITFNTTGTISLRNGGQAGGVIATSAASFSASSTHYLEFDVTVSATGAYNIYLDGTSILSGTGNTKTTGNTFVNAFDLGNMANSGQNFTADDFYLFDTSGSFNNAVLLTSPRIETQVPTSDQQTQFTNVQNMLMPVGLAQTGNSLTTFNSNAPGVDLALVKVTPAVACNLQSVLILPAATSAAAKFKAVLYTDSAGSPNTLTATGTEVIGAVNSTTLSLPFASGQSLAAGTSYWIGFITDTSVALLQFDATTNLGQKKANTYASGAPSPATGMTTGQPTWWIMGLATGATTNWESVAPNPASGDQSSISSSTVNNEDLYNFPALTTNPSNIYTVGVKAVIKKSDAGARTIDLRTLSSATDSAGSSAGQSPATSYGWMDSFFDVDPSTGVAWTVSGVNAAKSGVKVAS